MERAEPWGWMIRALRINFHNLLTWIIRWHDGGNWRRCSFVSFCIQAMPHLPSTSHLKVGGNNEPKAKDCTRGQTFSYSNLSICIHFPNCKNVTKLAKHKMCRNSNFLAPEKLSEQSRQVSRRPPTLPLPRPGYLWQGCYNVGPWNITGIHCREDIFLSIYLSICIYLSSLPPQSSGCLPHPLYSCI